MNPRRFTLLGRTIVVRDEPVYWRRRGIVLGIALAILVLAVLGLAKACTPDTPPAKAPATHSVTPTPAAPRASVVPSNAHAVTSPAAVPSGR